MAQYMWIFSLTSILLVLIGWIVVYGNAKKLATRSESKALVDNISKIINEVSELSIDFWLNSSKNGTTSDLYVLKIMSKITQAAQYGEIIKRRGLAISDQTFARMSEKATLDCETAVSLSLFDSSVRAQEVMDSCTSAILHIYQVFEALHPPSDYKSIVFKITEGCNKLDRWQKSLGPHF
jgi:hypothetical protein